MRDRTNRKFMHFDTFRSNRTEHRISKTTMRIVIFNREDSPLRNPRTIQQCGAVDRNNTIEIDDSHGDAGSFQYIVRLQCFKQRDAGRDDREDVRCG